MPEILPGIPGWTVGNALFSDDGRYRYKLSRTWDKDKPVVCYIGLNPSTADANKDDATIKRCVAFAKAWGYGGIVMVNIFALRATDPAVMLKDPDPIGDDNYYHICNQAWRAYSRDGIVVAMWGAHGTHLGQGKEVRELLLRSKIPVHMFEATKSGHPKHLLYVSGKQTPVLMPGFDFEKGAV